MDISTYEIDSNRYALKNRDAYPFSSRVRYQENVFSITPLRANRSRNMATTASAAGSANQIPVIPNMNGSTTNINISKITPLKTVIPMDGLI